MRFRRTSKGRKEPLSWNRLCTSGFLSRTGDTTVWDCENSPCQSEMTLFDAFQETGFGSSEGRVTVRRIHWPSSFLITETNGNQAAFSLWCLVVKTGLAVGGHVGNTLQSLLDGHLDILSVMELPCNQHFNGAAFNAINGAKGYTQYDFDIKAQRKLTNDERICALFGVRSGIGAVPVTAGLSVNVNTIVSALWQRTLR